MCAAYSSSLAVYNSLTDEHLGDYFANPRRLKHLRRMGLVTREGRLVEEGDVRVTMARREHQMRCKELIAESAVNRAVEMEQKRQAELKQKLELLSKYEAVERVKSQKRNPFGVQSFNPYYTVPHPPPLTLSGTLDKHADKLQLSHDQFSSMKQLMGSITRGRTIATPPKSPYALPVSKPHTPLLSVSTPHTPVLSMSKPVPRPPSAPKPKAATFTRRRSTVKNRPNTAPCSYQSQETSKGKQASVHSDVRVTLRYVGPSLHLGGPAGAGHTLPADVLVLQQHCGGNTVTLYKGKLRPREHFTFVSRRHLDMPFGVAIYLDGMVDLRLSACCEYRHQCGKLLGSKTSHFRLVRVRGGKPCQRCVSGKNKRPVVEDFEPLNLQQTRETEDIQLGDLLRDHLTHSQPLQSSSELMTSTARQRSPEEEDSRNEYSDDFSRSSSPVPPEVEDIEEYHDIPSGRTSQLHTPSHDSVNEGALIASLSLQSDQDRRSSNGALQFVSKKSSVSSLESGGKRSSESLERVSETSSIKPLQRSGDDDKLSPTGSIHSHTSKVTIPQTSPHSSAAGSRSSLHSEPTATGLESLSPTTSVHSLLHSPKHDFTTASITSLAEEHTSPDNQTSPPDEDTLMEDGPSQPKHNDSAEVEAVDTCSIQSDTASTEPQEIGRVVPGGDGSLLVSATSQTPPDVDTKPPEEDKDFEESKNVEEATSTVEKQLNESSLSSSDKLEDLNPVDPLSANDTLADAATMLKRTPSSDSLASILNDKSVDCASTVDLSDSEDEDFPELDKKLFEIIDSTPEETTIIGNDGPTEEVQSGNEEEDGDNIFERPPSRMGQYPEELTINLTPEGSHEALTKDHTEQLNSTAEEPNEELTLSEDVISEVASLESLAELEHSSDIEHPASPTQESVAIDDPTAEQPEENRSSHDQTKEQERERLNSDMHNSVHSSHELADPSPDESSSPVANQQAKHKETDIASSVEGVSSAVSGGKLDFSVSAADDNATQSGSPKKLSGSSDSSPPISISSSLTDVTSNSSSSSH